MACYVSRMRRPRLVVIGGPNGAGKSTVAPALLRDLLGITEFVNADLIAEGLAGFSPGAAAMQAGRAMLRRITELSNHLCSFAFETTLASRSFAPWLRARQRYGYEVIVIFIWLPTEQFALDRVHERARLGGHAVADHMVSRRYRSGVKNFRSLYAPLADEWLLFCNDLAEGPRLVASKGADQIPIVADNRLWAEFEEA
jgi:predicted ABC-type ATPase